MCMCVKQTVYMNEQYYFVNTYAFFVWNAKSHNDETIGTHTITIIFYFNHIYGESS